MNNLQVSLVNRVYRPKEKAMVMGAVTIAVAAGCYLWRYFGITAKVVELSARVMEYCPNFLRSKEGAASGSTGGFGFGAVTELFSRNVTRSSQIEDKKLSKADEEKEKKWQAHKEKYGLFSTNELVPFLESLRKKESDLVNKFIVSDGYTKKVFKMSNDVKAMLDIEDVKKLYADFKKALVEKNEKYAGKLDSQLPASFEYKALAEGVSDKEIDAAHGRFIKRTTKEQFINELKKDAERYKQLRQSEEYKSVESDAMRDRDALEQIVNKVEKEGFINELSEGLSKDDFLQTDSYIRIIGNPSLGKTDLESAYEEWYEQKQRAAGLEYLKGLKEDLLEEKEDDDVYYNGFKAYLANKENVYKQEDLEAEFIKYDGLKFLEELKGRLFDEKDSDVYYNGFKEYLANKEAICKRKDLEAEFDKYDGLQYLEKLKADLLEEKKDADAFYDGFMNELANKEAICKRKDLEAEFDKYEKSKKSWTTWGRSFLGGR